MFLLLALTVTLSTIISHLSAASPYQKVFYWWISVRISQQLPDFLIHFSPPSYLLFFISAWLCFINSIFAPLIAYFPFEWPIFIDLLFLFFSRINLFFSNLIFSLSIFVLSNSSTHFSWFLYPSSPRLSAFLSWLWASALIWSLKINHLLKLVFFQVQVIIQSLLFYKFLSATLFKSLIEPWW